MVMYFEDNTGRKEWSTLPKALAGMLTTDLAKLPHITVVERERLEALLKEIGLQKSKFFDPATAQQLGRGLTAQFALGGSIYFKNDQLRFDARLIRVETAEVVKSAEVSGDADRVFMLEKKLVAALGLASPEDAKVLQSSGRPNQPPAVPLEGVLEYGRGLQLGDAGDYKEAAQVLKAVVAKSPGFRPAEAYYEKILNDLIFARRQRIQEMDKTIHSMGSHARQALDESRPFATYLQRAYAIRILRGQTLLVSLRETLLDPYRDYDYLPQLVKFIENQLDLAAECQTVAAVQAASQHRNNRIFHYPDLYTVLIYPESVATSREERKARRTSRSSGKEGLPGGAEDLEETELQAAQELGIPLTNTEVPLKAYQVKRDLARFLLHGVPPAHLGIALPMEICWFKRSKTLESLAFELIKEALIAVKVEEKDTVSSEAAQILTLEAEGQLQAGRPELAIQAYKRILTTYPQSKQFEPAERQLRKLLDGDSVTRPCVDPPPAIPPKIYPYQVNGPKLTPAATELGTAGKKRKALH
jgi:TolB-like protein